MGQTRIPRHVRFQSLRRFWALRGRRFLLPVALFVLLWFAVAVALDVLTRNPFPVASGTLYRPLLNFLSGTRFLLLLFSTFFVYPFVFAGKAPPHERILAAFALPSAYVVWAIFQATAYFPLGEAIYYGFNPLAFGTFALQLALLSLAEIAGRVQLRRGGAAIPLLRWYHLAGIAAGFFTLYLTLFWDGGVHWFYVYQEGYKLLFQ